MTFWIRFWEAVCIVGLASFYLVVAIVVPLGARDLYALFRALRTEERDGG